MRSATGEVIEAYLGNTGHENDLPKGFAVRQTALHKPPWCFGKTLYIEVYSYMLQARNGDAYNHQVEAGGSIVLRAVRVGDDYYAFIVVVPSEDARFALKPLFI